MKTKLLKKVRAKYHIVHDEKQGCYWVKFKLRYKPFATKKRAISEIQKYVKQKYGKQHNTLQPFRRQKRRSLLFNK